MVAVGRLKKIWIDFPGNIVEKEFRKTFEDCFGAGWGEVLDAADKSFEYNAYNTAYFSVGNIESIENVTLDQLLEEKRFYQPPNVILS